MDPHRTASHIRTRALALAAAALAACSGGEDPPPGEPTFQEAIQGGGYWVGCAYEADEGHDVREVIIFKGAALEYRAWAHPTTDGTCGGDPVFLLGDTGDFTIGGAVQADDPDGAAAVTAYQLDLQFSSGPSLYTIGWVNASASPRQLFLGDDSGANDGSTPALRPTALQASRPRMHVAAMPPAFPGSLQGAFAACRNEGFDDYREVVSFVGSTIEVRLYDHSTADGTCGGRGRLSPGQSMTGPFTLGAAVQTSMGLLPIEATAADFAPEGLGTIYGLAWIDAFASRRTFYLGDDSGANDGSSPELRPDGLQESVPRYLLAASPTFPAVLQGSWENCSYEADSNADVREVFEFSGGTVTYGAYEHTTADGTCGGGETLAVSASGSYTPGGEVATTLDGVGVTAHALDLFFPVYTIVYVDTLASPYTLYIGDDRGANDGSTPALRPTALQEYKPRFRL